MSAVPRVGSWVWSEQRSPCKVIGIGTKRDTGVTMLKVVCPQGEKVIPLETVCEVSFTKPAPTMLKAGDRVKLKNTDFSYTLIEVFEVPYWINGDRTTETWARLKTLDGKPATWKLSQLEVTTACQKGIFK